MELITAALDPATCPPHAVVKIPVDRLTLAKRRWRALAVDGREFGFDLDHALQDGATVFCTEASVYQLAQTDETVVEMKLATAVDAARLGWLLGNLHFRIAVGDDAVHAPDDPAIRQLLDREHIPYRTVTTIFRPLRGGHAHGHHAH